MWQLIQEISKNVREKGEHMMAKRIAQFHKVSFEQFAEGFQDTFGEMKEGELKEI